MEDRGADDAVLPPIGGGGPPGRVHELGGLESQGVTLLNGNILKGAPPSPLSQISVPQVAEVPVAYFHSPVEFRTRTQSEACDWSRTV